MVHKNYDATLLASPIHNSKIKNDSKLKETMYKGSSCSIV